MNKILIHPRGSLGKGKRYNMPRFLASEGRDLS